MRVRALALAILVTPLLAGPGRALAFNLSGTLGVGYLRADQDLLGSSSTWDWTGTAQSAGDYGDGALALSANGFYNGRSLSSVDTTSATSRAWGGTLSLAAMTPTWHPVTVFAQRAYTDATNSTAAGPSQTGSTVTSAYGATALIAPRESPWIQAQVSRSENSNRDVAGTEYRSDADTVHLSAGQSVTGLSYLLSYATGTETGSLASSNFRSHALTADSKIDVGDRVSGNLSVSYGLRLPTIADPTSPRIENDALQSTLAVPLGPATNALSYVYGLSMIDTPGELLRQQTTHTVTDTISHAFDAHWSILASGAAAAAFSRVGDVESTSSGEYGGLGVAWNHGLGSATASAALNGTAGVMHADGADRRAWGTNGTLSISRDADFWRWRLASSLTYSERLAGLDETGLDYSVQANADWHGRRGFRVDGSAALRTTRRDSPTFGASLARTASGSLGVTWQTLSLGAAGGLSEGISGALDVGIGDTLFVPRHFNSTQRYATASAGWHPIRSLTFTLRTRILSNDYVDRPHEYERLVGGTARWSFGAWALSVEENVLSGYVGDAAPRTNTVLTARLTRSFGVGF